MRVILIGSIALLAILLLSVFWWHKRHRKKLRDLDQQIWAWESGALDVSLSPANNWLDYMIRNQGLGYRLFGSSKDVIIEKHEAYRSYFFTYKSLLPLVGRPVQGMIIQFKDHRCTSFAVMRNGLQHSWFKFDVGLPALDLGRYDVGLPADLALFGKTEDEKEIHDFLVEHAFLKSLFENRSWLRFYARHQFVVLYFSADIQDEQESHKALFGLDEKIARSILGEGDIDPVEEIDRLKNSRL